MTGTYAYYPDRYCYCNSDCIYIYIASVRMCIIVDLHIPVCDICISKYIHIYIHVYMLTINMCIQCE